MKRDRNKGVSPEEKERRRRRSERAEKAKHGRRRRRHRNTDGEITYTTAPEGYDGFGTRTIEVVGLATDGKEIRKVETPHPHGEWQRQRYWSGNHLVADEQEYQKLVGYDLVRPLVRQANAQDGDADYHRRNVILDEDLALKAMDWHGGQGSMVYSLASTAYAGHLVSPSMIDAAIVELEQDRRGEHDKGDRKLAEDLANLIGELDDVARFSDEHLYEGEDDGYATWLMETEQNPAPKQISGPLRVEKQSDGLWVVGQGLAVPVESRGEARELIRRLARRPNGGGATVISFDDPAGVAHGLEIMDLALRPSRLERPTVFHIDWGSSSIVLGGDPDDPAVDHAIQALEQQDLHFDVSAMPYAANPEGGTPGKAAGYAFLGHIIGGILGFGLGALVGGLAGAAAGGAPGAVVGALFAGIPATYVGGIWGAVEGAKRGAPPGLEQHGSTAAGIGAAIPYVNLFMAPLAAYLATTP